MKLTGKTPPALRVAAVWEHRTMRPMSCLHGLYRQIDNTSGVSLRKFDALATDFTRDVLRPLKAWQPHGVVVYLVDWDRLKMLRKQLPGVPFVATALAPPELVETNVAANSAEVIAVARDYYRACGLQHLALFTLASEFAFSAVSRIFLDAVPGGRVLACPAELYDPRTPDQKKRLTRIMTKLLRSIETPMGVLCLETEAASFLLNWCQTLGLRVPQDVQIIGVDEKDDCLACEPHLSSIELPNVRIGETAMAAMLQHLRHEQPPSVIRVPGGTVVARNSTGRTAMGKMSVSAALGRMESLASGGMTAARLAKQSGVCRATFYKEFIAAIGQTPARHLRQLRLEESCRQLREDSATITSIAVASGFKSLVAFIHFFQREMGETPSAYRKRMQGK